MQTAGLAGCAAATFLLFGACSGIAIQPSCPEELQVGEQGFVFANEENTGKVATYKWEVFPAGTGNFENAAAPDTTFRSTEVGTSTLRLTASDGLFMVQSECRTRVVAVAAPSVTLEADRRDVGVGDQVTLTCSGSDDAAIFSIEQVAGEPVDLTATGEGVVTFSPSDADTLVFECVGDADDGTQSDPVSITINVSAVADTGEDTPPDTGGDSGDAGAPLPDESPAPTDESVPTDGDVANAGGDTGDTTDGQVDVSPPDTASDNEGRPDAGRPSRGGGRGGR